MQKLLIASIGAAPEHLGADAISDWRAIRQEQIDLFAQATGDHQWIHVDPVRASSQSPFGATVAHGYLTLSLLASFSQSCIRVDGVRLALNYGLNKVRFPHPVVAGSFLRGRFVMRNCEPIEGGQQVTWDVTVEIRDIAKPACVAQLVSRWLA